MFFFPPFQTKAVYRKTPVVLVLCFVLTPLSALHPASSRGAQKRGRVLAGTSWARQVLPREFSSHSRRCVSLEQIWLTRLPWPASVGLRGVEGSKISFQSIKICRDIWNVQREQISRVKQSND